MFYNDYLYLIAVVHPFVNTYLWQVHRNIKRCLHNVFEINGLLLDATRSKMAIYAVNALLLALLGLSVVHWAGFYMDQKYNALLGNSQITEPARSAVGFNVDELISGNIFGAPSKTRATSAQSNIPLSSLNLKLTGVIASDRGGFALISVNGQPQTPFFIGEVIIDNALLDSVLPDRAILLRNGIKESLLLDASSNKNLIGRANAAHSSGSRMAPNNSIKKIGRNRFQISRKFVTHATANTALLNQALIVPNPQGGFIVKNIKAGGVIEKLGLRTGDIIRKVNNLNINSMVDVMQLYRLSKNINQVSNVRVEITRQGRRQILQYSLN